MKKTVVSLLVAGALVFGLVQPAAASGKSDDRVLKVGATPVPHAELLNLVKSNLAA